jgi:hypothetical protein
VPHNIICFIHIIFFFYVPIFFFALYFLRFAYSCSARSKIPLPLAEQIGGGALCILNLALDASEWLPSLTGRMNFRIRAQVPIIWVLVGPRTGQMLKGKIPLPLSRIDPGHVVRIKSDYELIYSRLPVLTGSLVTRAWYVHMMLMKEMACKYGRVFNKQL